MDVRALAPGDAKYEACAVDAVLDVRKPVAVRDESSEGVNAVPVMELDVGFSFIFVMYFSS